MQSSILISGYIVCFPWGVNLRNQPRLQNRLHFLPPSASQLHYRSFSAIIYYMSISPENAAQFPASSEELKIYEMSAKGLERFMFIEVFDVTPLVGQYDTNNLEPGKRMVRILGEEGALRNFWRVANAGIEARQQIMSREDLIDEVKEVFISSAIKSAVGRVILNP